MKSLALGVLAGLWLSWLTAGVLAAGGERQATLRMDKVMRASASAQNARPDAALLTVPLHEQGKWQVLQFSRLPPHRLRFSPAGLEIEVDKSAMPLIYPLPAPVRVAAVRVVGRVEGSLSLPPQRQGEERFDDYAFRIGLVEPGERTLSFLERPFAAAWVRKLFDLAPRGGGISRIHFFNVGAERSHIGRRRQHPASELLREEVVAVPRADGRFDFEHRLDPPLATLALWLSADGDDSGSRFTVRLERIELRLAH